MERFICVSLIEQRSCCSIQCNKRKTRRNKKRIDVIRVNKKRMKYGEEKNRTPKNCSVFFSFSFHYVCVCVEKVSAGQLVTQPFWVVQTLVGYCITVQLRRENPKLRREGGRRTDEVKIGDEERCVVCCFCFVYHLFCFGFFHLDTIGRPSHRIHRPPGFSPISLSGRKR